MALDPVPQILFIHEKLEAAWRSVRGFSHAVKRDYEKGAAGTGHLVEILTEVVCAGQPSDHDALMLPSLLAPNYEVATYEAPLKRWSMLKAGGVFSSGHYSSFLLLSVFLLSPICRQYDLGSQAGVHMAVRGRERRLA